MFRSSLAAALVLSCAAALAQQPGNALAPTTTSTQPLDTKVAAPDATMAHILVYRQRRYEGYALAPSIFVDDKPVARIGNGRRFSIKLTPGPHAIRSDDKSSAINIDTKPGQEYFIRVDEASGFWKGHGRLTMLMPEQGIAEYKLQKPIELDRRIATEMLEDIDEAPATVQTATPATPATETSQTNP